MKTIHVVAAIIKEENKIYSTHIGNGEFKDGWELPGGKVDPGEFFDEALVREIKEETNLDGAVGDFYEAIQDDYVHKRTVQVVMYLKNITGDVSISDEHDNWMWANLEKIKTLELSTAFEKVLKKKNWKI